MDALTRPAEIELTADLAVGDGLLEMLSGAMGALARRGSTAKNPSADTVHRFRVGLRRLRSILSAFGEALPERERQALGDRLRAVAQRFGRVREWDVFFAQSVKPLSDMLPGEEALMALERAARKARRQALPPGDTLRSNLLTIEAAIEEAPWLGRPGPDQAAIWDSKLRDYATQLLGQRHRRLRRRIKTVELTDLVAFHQLRIRVKKLRYPSELLKSLFDEDRAAKYLERLVDLQDVMGRLNDARVGSELLGTLEVPLAAQHLVNGWLARDLANGRERFPGYARAFRRADPFWEK
jgi:triphosphatase